MVARYRKIRTPFCPGIGIYAGKGSSHSWLWFVDLFERFGYLDLRFITERNLGEISHTDIDILAVSGGDTFSMAGAIGAKGAEFFHRFLKGGGRYIGSCAGAYLVMNSSKRPLNLFNFAPVKIKNLARRLPEPIALPHKFHTSYG